MTRGTPSKPLAAVCGWVFLGLLAAALPLAGQGNSQITRITDTSNGTILAVLNYGSLTPGNTTSAMSQQVQFDVRCRDTDGYRVDASATFLPSTTAAEAGGVTIAASDIGVGITSIVPAVPDVILPRTDTILSGFGYDPTTVVASAGVTPYLGAALGQATLADLSVSRMLLTGRQIASKTNNGQQDYLTVTMKFGLLPQYFTPGSFTATITMTISALP